MNKDISMAIVTVIAIIGFGFLLGLANNLSAHFIWIAILKAFAGSAFVFILILLLVELYKLLTIILDNINPKGKNK